MWQGTPSERLSTLRPCQRTVVSTSTSLLRWSVTYEPCETFRMTHRIDDCRRASSGRHRPGASTGPAFRWKLSRSFGSTISDRRVGQSDGIDREGSLTAFVSPLKMSPTCIIALLSLDPARALDTRAAR